MAFIHNDKDFTFVWKIKQFSFITTSPIKSSTFSSEITGNTKWSLNLCLHETGNISCQACKEDNSEERISISYCFKLLSNDEEGGLMSNNKVETVGKAESVEWHDFITYKTILDNRNNFLKDDCLIFHFSMWNENSEKVPTFCMLACTEIEVQKHLFYWRIEDFSYGEEHSITFYFSEDFSLKSEFLPFDGDNIQLTINPETAIKKPYLLKTQLSLVDDLGHKRETKSFERVFRDNDDQVWNLTALWKKRNIMAKKQEFLIDNGLHLCCEFCLSEGHSKNTSVEYQLKTLFLQYNIDNTSSLERVNNKPKMQLDHHALQKYFQNLYTNETLTDVEFKIDNNILTAHKAILSAKSSKFKEMFKHDSRKNDDAIVYIQDIDLNTFTDMLMFMYGGKIINLNFEKALKLIVAADKYKVLELRSQCSLFLESVLCQNNVCDILRVSHRIKNKRLQMVSQNFIKDSPKRNLLLERLKKQENEHSTLSKEVLAMLNMSK